MMAPQSTDMWRQSDCLSIAINYLQQGFHFFKPQVHNLFSQQGYAAGEFPLIYFTAALLFKLFGIKYYLFKGLNLLIFYTGIYFLFKLSMAFTKNIFLSFLIPVFYFCTPVIFFYANNYLSDVPAISFNIIAMFYFHQYVSNHKAKHLYIAVFCFTLAGLLKASAAILFFAVFSAILYEVFIEKKESALKTFLTQKKVQLFTGFIVGFLLIILWYRYAIWFNQQNGTIFFGTKAMKGWPLWEITYQQFKTTLNSYYLITLDILSRKNFFLFIITLIFLVFNRKKLPGFWFRIWLFLSIGLILFCCYFFRGFEEQGYYLVNLVILPLLTLQLASQIITELQFKQNTQRIIHGSLLILALLVTYDAKMASRVYYHNGWRHQKLTNSFYDQGLQASLLAKGITLQDKVISIPDYTPNASLVMLNRCGWSNYGFSSGPDYDPKMFTEKINAGAKFLVISDSTLLTNNSLKKYLTQPVGRFKEIYYFRL